VGRVPTAQIVEVLGRVDLLTLFVRTQDAQQQANAVRDGGMVGLERVDERVPGGGDARER
jgi:hypothetical protein